MVFLEIQINFNVASSFFFVLQTSCFRRKVETTSASCTKIGLPPRLCTRHRLYSLFSGRQPTLSDVGRKSGSILFHEYVVIERTVISDSMNTLIYNETSYSFEDYGKNFQTMDGVGVEIK